MGDPEVLRCEWCETEFERPSKRGPVPKYCSAAHRQAAHRARQAPRVDLAVFEGLSEQFAAALPKFDYSSAMSELIPKIDSATMFGEDWDGIASQLADASAGLTSGVLADATAGLTEATLGVDTSVWDRISESFADTGIGSAVGAAAFDSLGPDLANKFGAFQFGEPLASAATDAWASYFEASGLKELQLAMERQTAEIAAAASRVGLSSFQSALQEATGLSEAIARSIEETGVGGLLAEVTKLESLDREALWNAVGATGIDAASIQLDDIRPNLGGRDEPATLRTSDRSLGDHEAGPLADRHELNPEELRVIARAALILAVASLVLSDLARQFAASFAASAWMLASAQIHAANKSPLALAAFSLLYKKIFDHLKSTGEE